MNGVHDMGGMDGLGAIAREENEPVFHTRWEARTFALVLASGAWGLWNIDASRHQRELIPGPDYLRMSYYEKWLAGLVELLVKSKLVTRAEIVSDRPERGTAIARPALLAGQVAALLDRGTPFTRTVEVPARFALGSRVRARNLHPTGHTRLPRYARGHTGVVTADHGVHVFPDSNAHFLGEQPQRLYCVRFAAAELWGDSADPRDSVSADLWEGYLDGA
ncbi:MAG TPA: nitrile hydratase subunit beta [Steroidobacteraceae bacterium]|nr:nitrile hydratase subunit beta [Steroidobacteraceae bacterium]